MNKEFLWAISEDLSMILEVLKKDSTETERKIAASLVTLWIGQINRKIGEAA